MLPEATGRGQHFQACVNLAHTWVRKFGSHVGLFSLELALVSADYRTVREKSNGRTSE